MEAILHMVVVVCIYMQPTPIFIYQSHFTTLSIANNGVGTQSWVTSSGYLTALRSAANFTTLTIANNAVAT